ncbi:HAD family hydrolase [Pikeienuella piscinae]|nr:HAD-IA family hydrolase [Pikeienuella piscinae]
MASTGGGPFRTVVFDLDGTLVDSLADVAGAANDVLAAAGLRPVPRSKWPLLLGEGVRIRMRTAFALNAVTLEDEALDRQVAAFRARYADKMLERTRPYDGVAETLAALGDLGVISVVCTNKDEADARRILRALGLMPHIANVAGPDTFGVQKPDPQHILKLLEAAGADPGAAIMVGDTIHDVEAARRAGLPVAFASWGYGTPGDERPDYVVPRMKDLQRILSELPNRREYLRSP